MAYLSVLRLCDRGGDAFFGLLDVSLQAPHLAVQVWQWKSSIFHFQLNFEGFSILAATLLVPIP